MRYAIAAVHVLQWQGQNRFAVDYAYRVLRAHTSEVEAYKAYGEPDDGRSTERHPRNNG